MCLLAIVGQLTRTLVSLQPSQVVKFFFMVYYLLLAGTQLTRCAQLTDELPSAAIVGRMGAFPEALLILLFISGSGSHEATMSRILSASSHLVVPDSLTGKTTASDNDEELS